MDQWEKTRGGLSILKNLQTAIPRTNLKHMAEPKQIAARQAGKNNRRKEGQELLAINWRVNTAPSNLTYTTEYSTQSWQLRNEGSDLVPGRK